MAVNALERDIQRKIYRDHKRWMHDAVQLYGAADLGIADAVLCTISISMANAIELARHAGMHKSDIVTFLRAYADELETNDREKWADGGGDGA